MSNSERDNKMAGSVNKVMLLGRLAADPELRFTPSGTGVCNFRVATDKYAAKNADGSPGEKKADFHNVVVWNMGNRKLAELCAKYLSKGRLVYLEGRLENSSWDDKETGAKRYKTEVNATDVQFIDSRRDGEEGNGSPTSSAGAANADGPDIDPADIPF